MSRIGARHGAPLILCPVRATQVLSTTGFISRRFGLVGGLAVVALLAATEVIAQTRSAARPPH
jgi:hypothetical protein